MLGAFMGTIHFIEAHWDTALASVFVLVFFAIHLASRRLERMEGRTLSLVMSAAGGVSAAYVFLHLLPELRRHAEVLESMPLVPRGEDGVYLLALAGLIVFFGIERLVIRAESRPSGESGPQDVGLPLFWTHIGAFAVNSFVIGHLLVERREEGGFYLLLYAVALGLHFMTNDHALRQRHSLLHRRHGRWVLAAAVVLGWAAGLAGLLPDVVVTLLFALLAGGIIFNVLKEELPPDRGGSFPAFVAGACGYAMLLTLADWIS